MRGGRKRQREENRNYPLVSLENLNEKFKRVVDSFDFKGVVLVEVKWVENNDSTSKSVDIPGGGAYLKKNPNLAI